jgi:hypothetical protein
MRTYYRGPDVVVTTTVFAARGSQPCAIRELRDVCIHHVTTGVVLWRLRPQFFVLRATYRGNTVTLYASTNKRVFNQVSRALRRAIEDARLAATWEKLASA